MRKTAFLLASIIAFIVLASFMQRNTRYYSVRDIGVKEGARYDVRMYGAIAGDEISDILAIQAALDSAGNDGGGTVFFPPGQYEWYGENVTVSSNTTIWAYGAVFNDTTGGESFFVVNGDSDITFKGGEWNGNADVDGGYNEHNHGIDLIDGFRIYIEDTYMHDLAGDGVYVADVDYLTFTNNTIISTHLQDSPYIGRNGIAVVEGDNIIISGNILEGGAPANIDIEPNTSIIARNILIEGNELIGGINGLSLNAGAASTKNDSINVIGNLISRPENNGIRIQLANYFNILGNTITSSGWQGIWADSGSHDFKISDNSVTNAGLTSSSGSGIEITEACRDFVISNNMAWNNRIDGINVTGSSGEENLFATVTGNVCWNNDNLDAGANGGIRISYTDSSYIDDNYCFDSGDSKTQTFGFIFDNCDVTTFGNGNRGVGNDARLYAISTLTKEIIGQSAAYTWIVDDIVQGLGFTDMNIAGGAISEITVPFDCQIIALSLATSDTVTANDYTVTIFKNEVTTGFFDTISSGGDVRYAYRTLLEDSDSDLLLVTGDRIQVKYNTNGGMTPTGSLDVSATVLVKY